jgi:hypothetical protein
MSSSAGDREHRIRARRSERNGDERRLLVVETPFVPVRCRSLTPVQNEKTVLSARVAWWLRVPFSKIGVTALS